MSTTSSAVSAAPGWAETTIRWLMSSHPQYVHHSVKKPFAEKLEIALQRMCIDKVKHDAAGHSKPDYDRHIKDLVKTWDKARHDNMVAWLAAGGFQAELDAHREAEFQRQRDELIALEMATDEDSHVALSPTDRSTDSPSGADLDEVLLAAERAENPEMGSW